MTSVNDGNLGRPQRITVYVMLTVLFTLVMVNYSSQYGRLAVGPTDDDCNYLVDALQRLQILHDSPKNFIANLIQYPPHSPFSTGLAMFGFLIFGPQQWAPYVCNALVLFGLLLIVDHLTAGTSNATRAACIVFTLSYPFTANVITEFRPDCAVGIVTAFGLYLLMRKNPLAANRNEALLVGFTAALALLIKPTFAPFTMLSYGAAWLISVLLIHGEHLRGQLHPKLWLQQLCWLFLPVLILALPYYLLHPEVAHYIHNQAFGVNRDAFALNASPSQVLRYYWDGAGGQMMLGRHKYLILLLGLAAVVLLRRHRSIRWRFVIGYTAVVGITFLIPTMTRMSNPFFGANGNVLGLLGAILILAALLRTDPDRARGGALTAVTAWIVVVLGVAAFRWPPANYDKRTEWVQTVNRLGEQIYATIRDYPGSRNARVFFTAPGPVDDMLLRYNALADRRNFFCPARHLSRDLNAYRDGIEAADFVVASEAGTGVVYENMMAADIQNATLEMVRDNAGLTELARLPALNGRFFFVFVRHDLSSSAPNEKQVPFADPWAPLYARN